MAAFEGFVAIRPTRFESCAPVFAIDDLVPRYVAAAQYSTEATAVLVFSGVPSIAGEVDTAAERQRVIDDRDFW